MPLTPSRGVIAAVALLGAASLGAAELHVALSGRDSNTGTAGRPFRTIQHAADLAQPGDTVIVHAGIYRERVSPPRGGTSESRRITYEAAPGERVEIAGSEVVTGWKRVNGDTWTAAVPNERFGKFNPFADVIHGDWFEPQGRVHHTGAVYVDGDWLWEAASRDEVMGPVSDTPSWFARVDDHTTTLWAQFKGIDPNAHTIEVNARQTVFYPDQPGRNYITVRGFILRDAATPWAPPTAEQMGIIGTHWSKGWIIEHNTIEYATCSGVALGKYGDEYDNKSAEAAEGYVATIARAHAFRIPWSRDAVGHHVVRGNTIAHCEQAGIVGSLGGAFSTIEDNVIHDIHVRRRFSGAEMAGIKLHGAVDVTIRHNHIHHTVRAIWLDWMAQGTRVTGNLFHDNGPSEDLLLEVDHGPYLIDNNLFLSRSSILDISEGGAFVHNLIGGRVTTLPDDRETPFLVPHGTETAGLAKIRGGDDRFFDNLFFGRKEPLDDGSDWSHKVAHATAYGLCCYDHVAGTVVARGNVYLAGACSAAAEARPVVLANDGSWRLTSHAGHETLELELPAAVGTAATVSVTTATLGMTQTSRAKFQQPEGTPLRVDTDYFGRQRQGAQPAAGPFQVGSGHHTIQVW